MKKIIVKICIAFLLALGTFGLIWVMPGTHPHDLAVLVNKREMLKSFKSPRLIFMGGSSQLTLGSAEIEKSLGYSVLNMAVWGGLSTKEYLDEIKPYLNRGDIVIVTQEYAAALDPKYIYFINTNTESKQFFFLLSPTKRGRRLIRQGEYLHVMKTVLELNQIKARSYLNNLVTFRFSRLFKKGFPGYDRDFNDHGDRTKPFNIYPHLSDTGKKYSHPKRENHLFLNDFNKFAAEKGVKVLFYFSHFPEEEYRLNEQYINEYYRLIKDLLKFPVINRPSDFRFPRSYFADTIYHLNEQGEKERTRRLIQLLKPHLKQ
jgi:hypothetical protein